MNLDYRPAPKAGWRMALALVVGLRHPSNHGELGGLSHDNGCCALAPQAIDRDALP